MKKGRKDGSLSFSVESCGIRPSEDLVLGYNGVFLVRPPFGVDYVIAHYYHSAGSVPWRRFGITDDDREYRL